MSMIIHGKALKVPDTMKKCRRVSEGIGLTWSDVDMKNLEIHVGGQPVYYKGDERYC